MFGFTQSALARAGVRGGLIDPGTYRAEQFAQWLPYLVHEPALGGFVNQDSIGFVLELVPQTGADEEMAQILSALYASAPEDCAIQLTLFASPHIGRIVRAYGALRRSDAALGLPTGGEDERRNHNVFRTTARRRIAALQTAAKRPLSPQVGSLLREFRLIVSVTLPGSPEQLRHVEALRMQRIGMQGTLRSAGFPSREWGPDDLINWGAMLLNPQRLFDEQVALEYDPLRAIREQLIDRDTHLSVRADRLVTWKADGAGHTTARVYTVKGYPRRFALWNMGTLIGDLHQAALQCACPFLITMGVFFKNRDAVRNLTHLKQARATQNAASRMAPYMPQFAHQKLDWDIALAAIDRGGTLADVYHHVVLFAANETIAREEQLAKAVWATKGFDLSLLERVQLPAYLASLPMALSKPLHRDLAAFKLVSPKTSDNVVHLAPMLAEWSGTRTPALVLAGRRGQLATFDFFDNKAGNYNVAVAGASGSGKSVLCNDIVASYFGIGAKVWIIDIGRSYQNLAEHSGGDFIEFRAVAEGEGGQGVRRCRSIRSRWCKTSARRWS